MTLTPTQVSQILGLLIHKVDEQTFQAVKMIFDLQSQGDEALPEGESYTNIRQYCQRLRDKLIASGKGIVADDPGEEMLMVYMDRNKVKRLFNSVPADGYVAAFPGIHTSPNGQDQLTISLLAADKSFNILPAHINGNINGEQSWDNRTMMCDLETILR